MQNVEHILIDAVGRQHVILRAIEGTLQITITGSAQIVSAPAAFSLLLQNVRDIGRNARHLTRLQRLLAAPTLSTNTPLRWTAQTKRMRDALIALDGRRAGASFREVAIVIYGRERIDRDWPGTGLKVRVHRDFQRGLALANGGYRDLLTQG